MEQNKLFELKFKGSEPKSSHVAVDLVAEFACGEKIKAVKGFYDGDGTYIVRFLPETPGDYVWHVKGVIEANGQERCVPSKNKGIIRVKETHFIDANGDVFLPIGTTVYALSHQTDKIVKNTFKSLKNAPFNKIRHCVFPKHYEYNNNEPELFPFEKSKDNKWDVNKPCFKFWKRLERNIFRLAKLGLQSDLILFHPYDKWGFSEMSREENYIYLDYVIRRFSAIPEIWWSIANEFDLFPNRTIEEWYGIEEYIAENDVYGHLLSNHNCFSFYDFTRKNITHCCIQTTQVESAGKFIQKYKKPVIFDECCYEGNLPMSWGNISAFEMVNRFWIATIQGASATHGETYLSDDEVLWWAKGGKLKGKSPKRINFMKTIFENIPYPLDTWAVNPLENLSAAEIEKILNSPIATLPSKMSERQQEALFVKDAAFMGRKQDDCFMQYFARHCCAEAVWNLPENKRYGIYVIDVWNMKKTKILNAVNGKIHVKLPGKEGIALLAIAE